MMKNKYFLAVITVFFSALSFAQVGINTPNPDPNTKLDVNGDVIVQHPDTEVSTNLSQLFRRKSDGRVVLSKTDNKRLIYTLGLKINMYRDKYGPLYAIDGYNTGIYEDLYYVTILDAVLMDATTNQPAFVSHHKGWKYDEINPLKQASLRKVGVNGFGGAGGKRNVWFLQANFSGNYGKQRYYRDVTLAEEGHSFYWLFKLLVIDKNLVTEVDANAKDNSGYVYQLSQNATGAVNKALVVNNYNDDYVPISKNEFDPQNKFVGIGTNSPVATLDVNGYLNIRNVTNTSDKRYAYPLLVNTSTNKISVFQTEAERKPFVSLKGKFNIKDEGQDYIYDVNTNIPKESYVLVPTNIYLGNKFYDEYKTTIQNKTNNGVFGIAHYKSGSNAYNAQQKFEVKEVDDAWHFTLDYSSANPVCGTLSNSYALENVDKCKNTYYWNADFLAISTTYAKSLGTFEDTMNATEKALPDIPRGDKDIIKYMLSLEDKKNNN